MSLRKHAAVSLVLERFSGRVAHWTGSSAAFAVACAVVVVWAATGPIFGFGTGWQGFCNVPDAEWLCPTDPHAYDCA